MDERAAPRADRPWTRLDWKLVALLALLAGCLRFWQLEHTEVAARDSIGFIRHAWQFHQAELTAWPGVIKESYQHPLYPLWVLAVAKVIEPHYEGPTTLLFQYAAQIASAIAAVLLVLPLFALGRELFDRRVGFFSALLLQCLPVSGRLLADGLSEATFLLFAASALYFGIRALRQPGGTGASVLTGFFSGLAYLTRPEGAFIAAATGVMLLTGQLVRSWRRPWRDVLVGGGALSLAALSLAAPFVMATGGKLTVKPSIKRIGDDLVEGPRPHVAQGVLFAIWEGGRAQDKPSSERFWWGFWALGSQVVKGSFYLGWAAALLGMWCYRKQILRCPDGWMLLLVCLGVAYGTWRVAVVVGYLSDRHLLLLLLCGTPWAVAGVIVIGEWLAKRWSWCAHAPLLLPLTCVLVGLPKVLESLHWDRAGFREVGFWLSDHTQPADVIIDPLCWSHYYAGRVFLENTEHPLPTGYRPHMYIVLETSGNLHPRVPLYALAMERAKKGKLVHVWQGKRGKKEVEVHVIALPMGA